MGECSVVFYSTRAVLVGFIQQILERDERIALQYVQYSHPSFHRDFTNGRDTVRVHRPQPDYTTVFTLLFSPRVHVRKAIHGPQPRSRRNPLAFLLSGEPRGPSGASLQQHERCERGANALYKHLHHSSLIVHKRLISNRMSGGRLI
jgi:hypothetical protein